MRMSMGLGLLSRPVRQGLSETALQQILALSPSLLIWPEQGAGWQGTSGGTLSATGQPVGLLTDLAALGGRTQAEWVSSAPELYTGGVDFGTPGYATFSAGTWEIWRDAGGAGSVTLITNSPVNTGYLITLTMAARGADQRAVDIRISNADGIAYNSINGATGVYTVYVRTGPTISNIGLYMPNVGFGGRYSNISIKELPGNHLRAGTWASPADAARATYVIQTAPALYNVSGQPELSTTPVLPFTAFRDGVSNVPLAVGNVEAGKAYILNLSGGARTGSATLRVSGSAATYTPSAQGGLPGVSLFIATATGACTVTGDTQGFSQEFTAVSLKEIPVSQYKYALNFDGVDDYYSLRNAISITENMTVVRAFKRASAGISSFGIGESSATTQRDFTWASTNDITSGLGASNALLQSGNTSTGSFVGVSRRNASTEIIRLNGTQNGSRTAAAVSGSFNQLGRLGPSAFGIGEISFLAVFPTELTGANLALVEQIAAATNGATLP